MNFREDAGYDLPSSDLPPLDFQSAMTLEMEKRDTIWWCDRDELKKKNQDVLAELLNLDNTTSSKIRKEIIKKRKDFGEKAAESGLQTPKYEIPEDFFELSNGFLKCINLPHQSSVRTVSQEVVCKPDILEMAWEMDPMPMETREDVKEMEPLDDKADQDIEMKEADFEEIKEAEVEEMKEAEVDKMKEAEVEKMKEAEVEEMKEAEFEEMKEGIENGSEDVNEIESTSKPGKEVPLLTLPTPRRSSERKVAPPAVTTERKPQDAKAPGPIRSRPKRKETISLRRNAKLYTAVDDCDKAIGQVRKVMPVSGRPTATAQELAFQKTLEANEAFKPVIIDNGSAQPVYPTLQDATASSIKGSSFKFACQYCKRGFQQRYKWANHVKIHIAKLLHNCSCVRCNGVPYRDYRTMRKHHNDNFK